MLLKGIAFGLLATAANFGLFYFAVKWLLRRRPGRAQRLVIVTSAFRYLVFGALVYLFLRFRLGSIAGLLVGMGVGIVAYMTWQVLDARSRRSG